MMAAVTGGRPADLIPPPYARQRVIDAYHHPDLHLFEAVMIDHFHSVDTRAGPWYHTIFHAI